MHRHTPGPERLRALRCCSQTTAPTADEPRSSHGRRWRFWCETATMRRQRCRRGLPLSNTRGHDADPGSHTCASTNAGLDRRVPTNLLVATSRAQLIASSGVAFAASADADSSSPPSPGRVAPRLVLRRGCGHLVAASRVLALDEEERWCPTAPTRGSSSPLPQLGRCPARRSAQAVRVTGRRRASAGAESRRVSRRTGAHRALPWILL
jgi:hypothetical protein